MNSSRNNGSRERTYRVDQTEELSNLVKRLTVEKFKFKTMINGIEGPTISIDKLDVIESQDIDKWVKQYQNIVTLCEMKPELP
ncbi:hypothetical protein M153_29400001708 [Pseudoloma neurophilia]|uniref:Uncharacterized protein n=1 Tax=Pseudoloma neurophilia TaxID=146866 RepID=A0A0R0LTY7_9MICR|nr:hypothetical protein M153_29400001708 [Pseudoloma neurophilia]